MCVVVRTSSLVVRLCESPQLFVFGLEVKEKQKHGQRMQKEQRAHEVQTFPPPLGIGGGKKASLSRTYRSKVDKKGRNTRRTHSKVSLIGHIQGRKLSTSLDV